MLRFALLVGSLGLSGCFFVFGDDGGSDDCLLAEPAIAPAPLRNPDTLACESFGGGCDPNCGPCPAATDTARVAPTPPLPSWNTCGHRCETLNESACAADAECRVVKDVRCAVWMDCETDFLGCFPTDTAPDQSIDCARTFDGWECSRSNACTAFHYGIGGRSEPQQLHPFATCMPEGSSPGTCWDPVGCDAAAPACPEGTTPGVVGLCYSGGCIPLDACEPRPNE